MELVERYLAAIARQLPKSQRDDVVAELRDEILSRIEEREADLGRPLGPGETEDLLRQIGHPLVVAARYWPIQRLIGPETFPFYVYVLRTVLLIVVGVQVILAGISMATSAPPGLQALNGFPGGLISSLAGAFAWVTLVFVGLEYFGVQRMMMRKWRPGDLPPANVKRRRSRFDVVFEAAAGVVVILWWTGVIHFSPFLNAAHPEIRISLSAAWAPLWAPILAVMCLQLAANLAELARPSWERLNAGAMMLAHAALAVIGVLLTQAGQLVDVAGGAPAQTLASITDGVNLGLRIGFGFAAAISAVQALMDLRRVVRGGPAVRGLACI